MAEKKKHPGGRPTSYKPEYCQKLIDHMAAGLSFESFAGTVDVSKQTIYDWTEKFPEFIDAKRRGTEKSRAFWEGEGLKGLWNESGEGARNLNNVVWVFNMKNRFGWRDKQPDEVPRTNITVVSTEDEVNLLKGYLGPDDE